MENCTQKSERKYSHLTVEEREEIAILLSLGLPLSEIARGLGRDKSTVSREVRRNNAPVRNVKYRASQAQKRSDERKRESHTKERLADPRIRAYVEDKLKNARWTPEMIAGRLPGDCPGLRISYEAIYQWIYQDRPDLIAYLARGHRKRQKRGSAKGKRAPKIPGRTMIGQRPADIESRLETGHWEADTVVSRQSKAVLMVAVERKNRLFVVQKMDDKTAGSMHRALVRCLARFPEDMRKSITYDNGTENALHELTNQALGTASYFCEPYHSWEKGSIENRNGMLRRFFPKTTDWALTSQKQLDRITKLINSMPLKLLDFKTPLEVFAVALAG